MKGYHFNAERPKMVRHKGCKIFKVCPTILGCSTLKGKNVDFEKNIFWGDF